MSLHRSSTFCFLVPIVSLAVTVLTVHADECMPTSDGYACTPVACSPIPEDQCISTVLHIDWSDGAITAVACACMDMNACHIEFGNATPFAVGYCPDGGPCVVVGTDTDNDGQDDQFSAECSAPGGGVCCLDIDDGPVSYDTCVETDEVLCHTDGGVFCEAGAACIEPQACCLAFAGGSYCAIVEPHCCLASGGVPLGPSATCDATGGTCARICGGIGGDTCDLGEYCRLNLGECCCDFQGVCTPIPNTCPEMYDPVCGCDGVTYDNECFAAAAGVSISHPGVCELPCTANTDCPAANQYCRFPDGTCGDPAGTVGLCSPRPNGCPDVWDPVCGCDGVTYGNDCEAAAAGVSIAHTGPCELPCTANTDCPAADQYCRFPDGTCGDAAGTPGVCTPRPNACPDVWDPVCGCDGVTYGNDCDAAAAGVSIAHYGACSVPCSTDADCPANDQYCRFPIGSCGAAGDPGVCAPRHQDCPAIFDPVCGCDGNTYSNECQAAAAGVSIAHDGPCEQICVPNDGTLSCPPDSFCRLPNGICGSADVHGFCQEIPASCPDVVHPVCGCDGVTYGNECEALMAGVSIHHCGPCNTNTALFLVPHGEDPNGFRNGPSIIPLTAGSSLTLDVYVDDTDFELGDYLVVLGSATGGDTGFVTYELGTATIDTTRPDWVYAESGEPCGFAGCTVESGPPARFGGIGDLPAIGVPRYCGEITYTASLDAEGSFVIGFIDPATAEGTHLADPTMALMDAVTAPGIIVVQGRESIPAASTWGLILMTLLVLASGTIVIRRLPSHA